MRWLAWWRSLISYLHPARNAALLELLAAQQVTAVAMDAIPRTISRAQTFDSLSSQANIAGYRHVFQLGSIRVKLSMMPFQPWEF